MKIPLVNIKKQSLDEKKILYKCLKETLEKSDFILGKDVAKLEKNLAKYKKSKYACLVNSGTDALVISLFLSGIKKNDEVITAANSFVASAAAIAHLGAIPVFADVKEDLNIDENKIEKLITKKTKAIMPVHLTGRVCEMKKILKIAKKYNLKVIEDAAQAFGSKIYNKFAGTFGDYGCFSLHPLKNLNAIGDGGIIFTNNKNSYERIKRLRNHGLINRNESIEVGYVSRLDTLKARVVNNRLKKINNVIKKRRKNAELYRKFIKSHKVLLPKENLNEFNTYHTFIIQVKKRNELIKFLSKNGISTAIHYPIPICRQRGYKKITKYQNLTNTLDQSKKILTLPIHQYLKESEIKYISSKINSFYKI